MRPSPSLAEIAALLVTVVMLANLVAVVGGIIAAPRPPEARVELLVGGGRSADDRRYREPLAAAGIAEVYARAATSQTVLAQAIARLDLEIPLQDLGPRVRTETVTGSSLFAIKVVDPDPIVAASIANEIAGILVGGGAAALPGRQSLHVVEAAVPPAGTTEDSRLAFAALAGVIALAIGLAIAFLPSDRDRRLHTAESP